LISKQDLTFSHLLVYFVSRVNIDISPVPVIYGKWLNMPAVVRNWAAGLIQMCQPKDLHIMDGSDEEDALVIHLNPSFITNYKHYHFWLETLASKIPFVCNLGSKSFKILISIWTIEWISTFWKLNPGTDHGRSVPKI
jgi:hypothetical protein